MTNSSKAAMIAPPNPGVKGIITGMNAHERGYNPVTWLPIKDRKLVLPPVQPLISKNATVRSISITPSGLNNNSIFLINLPIPA